MLLIVTQIKCVVTVTKCFICDLFLDNTKAKSKQKVKYNELNSKYHFNFIMGLLLMLKEIVNEKELLSFSKKSLFYSYFTLYRFSFLAIGHWPNQNKFHSFLLKFYQLIISAIMIKGQVNYYHFLTYNLCNFRIF